jgi:hypothetical protein
MHTSAVSQVFLGKSIGFAHAFKVRGDALSHFSLVVGLLCHQGGE